MIKESIVLSISLLSFSCFAASNCDKAVPASDPGFCASFKKAATCTCSSYGYPNAVCSDMSSLYHLMMVCYWSQKRACEHQAQTAVQTCIDDWNCYRLGGKDSQGNLCSSTGKSCE